MKSIKELREAKGLTREELMDLSGLSQSTIWKAEERQDYVVFNEVTAQTQCRSLGVEIDDVFRPNQITHRGRPPQTGVPRKLSREETEVICPSCQIMTNALLDTCGSCGEVLE